MPGLVPSYLLDSASAVDRYEYQTDRDRSPEASTFVFIVYMDHVPAAVCQKTTRCGEHVFRVRARSPLSSHRFGKELVICFPKIPI